jgi:hypothetical protein
MGEEQTSETQTDETTDETTEDTTQNPPDEKREGDGQDYIDRSNIDFDPDEGLLSGTAIDGTSDIPGPHEQGEDGGGEEPTAENGPDDDDEDDDESAG